MNTDRPDQSPADTQQENAQDENLPSEMLSGLPEVSGNPERIVEEGFWAKMKRVAGRIPFAEDVVAMYLCARDPLTPTRVRAVLLAALAYFVVPMDLIPDFLTGLGFTDDATVILTALGLVGSHIRRRHREAARETLGMEPLPLEPDEPGGPNPSD